MKLKNLHEEYTNLVRMKSELQDASFSISELQDGKQSALLYRLGEGIKKSNFPNIENIGAAEVSSLCKIFAISHPYSAIGLVKNKVYISLSQTNKIDLQKICKVTSGLVDSDLNAVSCIPAVAKFYEVLHKENNQYVKKIIDIKNNRYGKLKNPKDDLYTYAAKDDNIFHKYFNTQDIKNIKLIFDKKVTFEQLVPAEGDLHIHVELNLLNSILQQHKTSTNKEEKGRSDAEPIENIDLKIGVASSNIYEVSGCCGYCVATLKTIEEFHPITIERSGDFSKNIPKGHWDFPYKLLNTATKNDLFFTKLLDQYVTIVKDDKGNYSSIGNVEAFELLEKKLKMFKTSIFHPMYSMDAQLVNFEQDIKKLLIEEDKQDVVAAVTEICYDNEILNHPELLQKAAQHVGLSKAIDLSTLLSLDLVFDAIDSQDPDLVLAGMMSLDLNEN